MKLTIKEKRVLQDFFDKKIGIQKAREKLGYKSYQTVYSRTINLLRQTK